MTFTQTQTQTKTPKIRDFEISKNSECSECSETAPNKKGG